MKNLKTNIVLALSAALGFLVLPTTGHSAFITFNGAFTPLSSDSVDLTAVGTTDWVKFGIPDFVPPNYIASKSGATNISDASGATALNAIAGNQPTFTWTNGAAPDTSGSSISGFRNPGNGTFAFTVATANTINDVSVWFGAFGGTTGTFEVSLAGATTFSNSSSFVFPVNIVDKVMRYDFTLQPDTVGDVATFSWTTDASGILSAATLVAVPEPSTMALFAIGGAAMVLRLLRRRRAV